MIHSFLLEGGETRFNVCFACPFAKALFGTKKREKYMGDEI